MLVVARGLQKKYGDFEAVKGIDLSVPEGACFGFLGPNGAGKSTTLRMVTGFLPPTGGELKVLGLDPQRDARQLKARLGVVHQEDNLDEDLTVLDNLVVFAGYFSIPRHEAVARATGLLRDMQLEDRQRAPIRSLSGGMRRRLMIARALLNQPKLLVLDEPTTGLDPQARHLIWERLRALKQSGVSLLLCTHYMEEAERLCDDLVLLSEGRVVARGAPAELVRQHAGARAVELPLELQSEAMALLAAHGENGRHHQQAHGRVYLYFDAPDHPGLAALRQQYEQQGVFRQPNLEDVFLLLTGRELVE